MSTNAIVRAAIFSALLVLDVVGNTLVVLVVRKYRAMKTPLNYLLLHLAVADIMVALFFAPRFLFVNLFTHPIGTAGDFLCKFITIGNISWVASTVSAYILVCVAVERFYAVVRPTNTKSRITMNKVNRIVPACWIGAASSIIPSFIGSIYDVQLKNCREKYSEPWQYVTCWFFLLFVTGVVPVSVMAVLYARVIHSLWLPNDNSDVRRLAVKSARKRITLKSITVSVFYAVCVFPVNIFYVALTFYPNDLEYNDVPLEIAYLHLILNSSVNPLIYTLQCGKFRLCLKRLLGLADVTLHVPC